MTCNEQVLRIADVSDFLIRDEKKEKIKVIVAAGLGNFLEFFDFTVFSFFLIYIGRQFFGDGDSLMKAVMVFGAGFVARPLGSILLGTYADRRGRKAALLVTILFMATGSALIAFTPSPGYIGVLAPVLIIAGRLLQGFSAGGEIGAATTLMMESAAPGRRGFFVSWQFIGQSLSALTGGLFGVGLTYFLSEDQLQDWGWRVPFVFALLIIPVGLYIRTHIRETHAGGHGAGDEPARHPLAEIAATHLRQFILAIFMIMPTTILTYTMVFYMPTYLVSVTQIAKMHAYLVSVGIGIILLVFSLAGGLLSDRVSRRKPLTLVFLTVMLPSSFLVFYNVGNMAVFLPALAVTIAMLGMNQTTQTLIVMEAFPRHVRTTALAVTYSAGVMLFGGTAQIVVTRLLELSGNNPMAPFWYLGCTLVLGLVVYSLFREERYD